MSLDIKLTAHTKLIWSWIIDLNVAVRTIKFLGENIEECFFFFIFGISNDFLNSTKEAVIIKLIN